MNRYLIRRFGEREVLCTVEHEHGWLAVIKAGGIIGVDPANLWYERCTPTHDGGGTPPREESK